MLKSGNSLRACDTIVFNNPFTGAALVIVFTVELRLLTSLLMHGRLSTVSAELLCVSTVSGAPFAEVGISTVNSG